MAESQKSPKKPQKIGKARTNLRIAEKTIGHKPENAISGGRKPKKIGKTGGNGKESDIGNPLKAKKSVKSGKPFKGVKTFRHLSDFRLFFNYQGP